MLAAVVPENRKLKDLTRCLLDCPTKQNRAEQSRAEQSRAEQSRAELGELAKLRRRQTEEVQNRLK
jgi:hypothetical protein